MADIINLNKARKQRSKAEKKAQAAENRRRFGLSKGQKNANKADKDNASKKLEGLRLFRPKTDDD